MSLQEITKQPSENDIFHKIATVMLFPRNDSNCFSLRSLRLCGLCVNYILLDKFTNSSNFALAAPEVITSFAFFMPASRLSAKPAT